MQVPLRVRRVLEQLAVVVAVPLRRLDLRRCLEVQHPLLAARIRVEAPCRADREDEVSALRLVALAAEGGEEEAAEVFAQDEFLVGEGDVGAEDAAVIFDEAAAAREADQRYRRGGVPPGLTAGPGGSAPSYRNAPLYTPELGPLRP